MSRIPADATPATQQAFRELWAALDQIRGALNIDLKGRRVINAGPAIAPNDYVTLDQAEQLAGGSPGDDGNFTNLSVQQRSKLGGPVFVSTLQDAGIVFAKVGGVLSTDHDNFAWQYSNKSLRIDEAATIRWHHQIEMTSTTGVLILSGEDSDVTNQFSRLVGGLADTSSPAWCRDSTVWEAKLGDASAYTAVRASLFVGGAATTATPAWIPNGDDWEAKLGDASLFTTVKALKFVMSVQTTYTPTNVTVDRSYDANATTLDEVADVLGSLIQDLQTAGLLA